MNYDQIYKNKNVWGNQPNELLKKIYKRLNAGANFLDLGCGQGRDALFMALKGFKVTAIDRSQEGIKKIKEFIQAKKLSPVNINLFCEDIRNFNIEKNKYNLINAFNSLQFIPKKDALKIIGNIKSSVKNNGYIIISCFTTSDPLYKKRNNHTHCFFKPQELKKIFSDFNIIKYKEEIIKDKGHPGNPEPHTHGVVKMIAQKIKNIPK